MHNLDEDAKDLPFSAPTTTSIPFIPRERVAAKADRWFPSRMITDGFWRVPFIPVALLKNDPRWKGDRLLQVLFQFLIVTSETGYHLSGRFPAIASST